MSLQTRARQTERVFGLALIACLVAGRLLAAQPNSGFAPGGAARAFTNTPGVSEWRYDAVRGPSPMDRIALHRFAKGAEPPANPEAVLLYLPGTNMNGEAPMDDPHHVFSLYLASQGIDVWALDYRTHFVPPETEAVKLTELKGWTNELFESDIDAAVNFILKQTHRDKLFLAGFSRGVAFEYLYAANYPRRVQGLVVLDGFVLRPAAMQRMMGAIDRSKPADDLGGPHLTFEKRQVLLQMVIDNPDGAAPILKYKSARENLEHVVYDSAAFGGNGGLANPQGGFSDPVVLARVMIVYDRWWPSAQNGEDSLDAAHRQALAQSKIPVIAFSSTNIASWWPDAVKNSAHSTGSSDVSVTDFNGWGHLDVLCGTKAESLVYAPVAEWLKRHATAAGTAQ